MKSVLFFSVALMSLLTLQAAPVPAAAVDAAAAPAAENTLSGFDAEQTAARQQKRALFLRIDAPENTDRSRAMASAVFSRKQWTKFAAKKLVCVRVSATDARAAALMKQHDIRRLPAYLMFDADGTFLGHLTAGSYTKPRKFISSVEEILLNGKAKMPAPDFVDADGWMLDFPAARAKAKQLNRPLLLQFTGSDWCGFCMRMERQVFSQEAWKTYASAHLVAVKADAPAYQPMALAQRAKNEALAKKFGVKGLPTYLVFDADGNRLGELGSTADATPASFIAALEAMLKR